MVISQTLVMVALASTQVEAVVVYPDRAQVTRVAQVSCGGRSTVTFEQLPPSADPSTFRAAAAEGATVEGLQAREETQAEAYSEELAQVEAALQKAQAEAQALADDAVRTQTLQRLGAQYEAVAQQLVSREMVTGRPDLEAWQAAYAQALGANLEAADQTATLTARQRALSYRLAELQLQQARLQNAAQRRQRAAEVLVACPRGRTATVRLTYLVGGASWTPQYEVRAREPKASELSTWATVTQSTGEDWRGAKLLLSTAVPSQDATVPELRRLMVHITRRSEEKKVLVRREETLSHARVGEGGAQGGEQAATARAQGLSVQLEVPAPVTIPGNAEATRVFVGRHTLPAVFRWRSAPSLAPFVFRVAEITQTAPFPLLPGPLEVFGKSGFLGRYHQERVAQGAPFDVTFGVEDQLRVKRVVLEEVRREVGLFNQKKRFRYAYRFELENHAAAPVELELQDRVPVAELEDVTVTVDAAKTTPGYSVHPQDGLVTWKVKLGPGDEKEVTLHFHVDVPESYDTGGL